MGYTVRSIFGKIKAIFQYLPLIVKAETIIARTMVNYQQKPERYEENGESCEISKADAGLGLDTIHVLGIYEGGR